MRLNKRIIAIWEDSAIVSGHKSLSFLGVTCTPENVSARDPASRFRLLAKHRCGLTKRKERRGALFELRFVTLQRIEL